MKLIGEPVPHKLSQQVPTWSIEDVAEWVKQIGFKEFADSFEKSRVDGDLLLQLDDQMLRYKKMTGSVQVIVVGNEVCIFMLF